MLIDTCLLFDELPMLEFRMKYLWDHVDKFVICEADRTFSGEKKPYSFLENRERFDWAKDKIIYHPIEIDITGLDFSYKPTEFDFNAPQWRVENAQRTAILDACREFSDQDIIMLSDCDEIPSHTAIEFRKNNSLMYPMTCDQRVIPFFLNYTREDIGWRGTIMTDIGYARQVGTQGLRNNRIHYSPFPGGGWHLTFFGGSGQIQKKLKAYAHAEFNTEEYTNIDRIERLTKEGKGILPDDGQPLVKIDSSFYPVDFLKHVTEKGWWL